MSIREWLNLPLPFRGAIRANLTRKRELRRADRLACPRCGALLQHVPASAARPAHWECPECWVMYTVAAGEFRRGYGQPEASA
jgi:hypothetical protein